jgi:hypothetical protein
MTDGDGAVSRDDRLMGIEARCPNGHQVRVKDRFAGRKAYCPECAATFRVPMPGATATLPTAAVVSLDATYAATLPRATPAGTRRPDEPQRAERERPRRRRSAPGDAVPAAPSVTPAPAPAAGRLHPVIAEAVDLTWNVALPGGDPSEPLTAEMLQEWLDAGGATGTEVVWRADWPDWVPIRLVFPEHVPKGTG